jgi:putative transposase
MPLPDQETVNMMLFNIARQFPVVRVCKGHRIARSTFYYRLARYVRNGVKGLCGLSRKPKRLAHRLPDSTADLIIRIHEDYPHFSPPRIANELGRRYNVKASDSTVRKYVRQYDAEHHTKKPKRKIRKGTRPARKFGKLERVQLDFKGWFWLDRRKVYPIGAVDCGTRVRTIEFCRNMKSKTVIGFMERFIAKFGKPKSIQTDNGSCFVSREFRHWCRGNGIRLKHSPVGKPWYNGFIESLFKTFQKEFLDHNWFGSIGDAAAKLEKDDCDYNHERYHRTIKSSPWERFCGMK